jgi:hypothetical protein
VNLTAYTSEGRRLFIHRGKPRSGDSGPGLARVLHAGGDTLHGEDERVLQPRRVLAAGVELHQLISRLLLVGELLRQGRLWVHLEAGVADPLQGVGLAHVQRGDVGLTQPQTLLQIRIAFEDVLVTGNLPRIGNVYHYVNTTYCTRYTFRS